MHAYGYGRGTEYFKHPETPELSSKLQAHSGCLTEMFPPRHEARTLFQLVDAMQQRSFGLTSTSAFRVADAGQKLRTPIK
jgi:hypothetical protein